MTRKTRWTADDHVNAAVTAIAVITMIIAVIAIIIAILTDTPLLAATGVIATTRRITRPSIVTTFTALAAAGCAAVAITTPGSVAGSVAPATAMILSFLSFLSFLSDRSATRRQNARDPRSDRAARFVYAGRRPVADRIAQKIVAAGIATSVDDHGLHGSCAHVTVDDPADRDDARSIERALPAPAGSKTVYPSGRIDRPERRECSLHPTGYSTDALEVAWEQDSEAAIADPHPTDPAAIDEVNAARYHAHIRATTTDYAPHWVTLSNAGMTGYQLDALDIDHAMIDAVSTGRDLIDPLDLSAILVLTRHAIRARSVRRGSIDLTTVEARIAAWRDRIDRPIPALIDTFRSVVATA